MTIVRTFKAGVISVGLCLSLGLAGCSDRPLDGATAVQQIRAAMMTKQFANGTRTCTDYFQVLDGTVSDMMIDGKKAIVEVSITVKSKYALDVDGSANDCYGRPEDGWKADATSTGKYQANFELWNRGWRLVSMPEIKHLDAPTS